MATVTNATIIDSSFVTWCLECVSEFHVHATELDGDAHTAASQAAHFLADNSGVAWTVAASVALVVGLFFTFFGYEGFYATLGLVAFVTTSIFSFGLLCGSTHSVIAAIAVGVVCGILATILVVKLEKVGAALCGATGGVISYMMLNGLILSHLYAAIPEAHQTWTPIVVVVVLALAGAALAALIERPVIIAATALGGAYAVGWGIERLAFSHSALANVNPLVLVSGGGCGGHWQCYAFFTCVCVLAVVGVIVQMKRTRKDRQHEEGRVLHMVSKRHVEMTTEEAYPDVYYTTDVEGGLISSDKQRRISREVFA